MSPVTFFHHHAARLLVREVGDDLAQAEDAHGDRHEADAVGDLGNAEATAAAPNSISSVHNAARKYPGPMRDAWP